MASATTPAAGTAQTSERWWWASAASPVATSTVRSACGTVAIGFIAGAHAQQRSRAHAALGAAGAVAERRVMPSSPITSSSCAAEPRRAVVAKPSPTSTPLIAWMPMSARGELRVEAPVPVHVRAEARRKPVREHLDDAAEGVALLVGGVDLGDHRSGCRRVEAPQRVGVERRRRRPASGSAAPSGTAHGADRQRVADQPDAELGEERASDRAERDAGGGLASARALEHVAGLVEVVLLHADEVGVARPRAGERGPATLGK